MADDCYIFRSFRSGRTEVDMSFSLCLWEGDLVGAASSLHGRSLWEHETADDKIWSALPKEILENIIATMIPGSKKCQLRSVCKEWRQLLSSAGAFAPSPSPQLLGKLYWHPGERQSNHSYNWCNFQNGVCVDLKADDLQLSPSCCALVPRDSVLSLTFLPKLSMSPQNSFFSQSVLVQDGLLCIVHAGDVFEAGTSDVYLVNPMNRTWRLLPKCGFPVPGLRIWRVRVVVSRPPGCSFHVLVRGAIRGENCGIRLHFALLRYSSETGIWEFFPGRNDYRLQRGYDFGMTNFALDSSLMWDIDYAASTFQVYFTRQVGQPLSPYFESYIACPSGWDKDTGVILLHHKGVLFVGGMLQKETPWHFVGIWVFSADMAWERISAAPEALLGDFRHLSADAVSTSIADVKLVGDFVVISVNMQLDFGTDQDVTVPTQFVYFHLGDMSWHNSRKFFCANAKDASPGNLVFDDPHHHVFEPRLDILL